MRRQERNYEVKLNGVPQLKEMPEDLLELLCTALLDVILADKESEAGHSDVTEVGGR